MTNLDKATQIERMCEYLSKKQEWVSGVRKYADGSYSIPLCIDVPSPGRDQYDRFDVTAMIVDFALQKITAYFAKESGHNGDTYDEHRIDVPWARIEETYDFLKKRALRFVEEDVIEEERQKQVKIRAALVGAKLQEMFK